MSYLAAGIILGFSAGIAPGPLLALVIAETLEHDINAGIKVALAPVITDLPIVILTLLVFAGLSDFQALVGLISIGGGFFVALLAIQSLRTSGMDVDHRAIKDESFQKGVIVNFLSPHPYLFWLGVGAPMTVKAMQHSRLAAAAFIGGFYVFLIGSKIVVAVSVGKSRAFLKGSVYIWMMRCLGIVLFILAGRLICDGFKMVTATNFL
jgi:threonine/homoserine/homoserine lactone efflux protein